MVCLVKIFHFKEIKINNTIINKNELGNNFKINNLQEYKWVL